MNMSRKANVVDRISYQVRKSDGKTYATFCPADRRHGGKDKYLGIVIDKKNGIFYNRNRGYYRFTLEHGLSDLGAGELAYQTLINNRDLSQRHQTLCLDFGDSWFLDRVLTLSGLKNVLIKAFPNEADTLLSLILFKLLDDNANSYAKRWQEGNYAKYLYPSARLESQRISEFLDRLGDEQVKRNFFDLYIPYMKKISDVSENVLIDSTGLPNDIHFDISAISNHNGVISREARLIYVVERNTGFPIFFRYVAGNIVDVSTLRVTLNLMKAYEIDIHHSILDAGYSSDANLKKLISDKVPFLIRLPDNKATKKYLKEHGTGVVNEANSFKYGDRRMFMKREEYKVGNTTCYAYIAVDFNRQFDEQNKYLDRKDDATKKAKNKKTGKSFDELGYFVLLSSENLEVKEILPLYSIIHGK
jgi:hypothetical protein